MKAEDLEQTILRYCKKRKITNEEFMELLGQVAKENLAKEDITMSKIVELLDKKIKERGDK
jgi:hypothetical protein